jgi:hypothetical protein
MRSLRVPSKEQDMTEAAVHNPARKLRRALAIAVGALALASTGVQAAPHGGGGWHGGGGGGWHGGGGHYYRGGGWGFDPFWGVGLGLGLALATAPLYYDNPGVVYVNPPPVYYPPPVYGTPTYSAPVPAPSAPAAADPIFYPRSGQSAAQTEADRQDCNRWATTQRNAMSDGSVFQRATLACMDGRGYTAR